MRFFPLTDQWWRPALCFVAKAAGFAVTVVCGVGLGLLLVRALPMASLLGLSFNCPPQEEPAFHQQVPELSSIDSLATAIPGQGLDSKMLHGRETPTPPGGAN